MNEPKELTELETEEVSLVDKGANRKKRFPVFKSEKGDQTMTDETIQAVLEIEAEGEAEFLAKAALDPKAVNAVKAALRILNGFKDVIPTDVLNQLAAAAGYPKPDSTEGYPAPAMKAKKDEEKAPCAKTEEEKGMTTAIEVQKEALDALKAENERISKELKEERDRREENDWTEKAKTDLSHFPGKTSVELGKILKSLNDVNPELAKTQFEAMKSASNLIKSSSAFRSEGLSVLATEEKNETSAWAQIKKLADGIVEKSVDINLTPEKAVDRVLKSERGQALYKKYLEEHPEQTSNRIAR